MSFYVFPLIFSICIRVDIYLDFNSNIIRVNIKGILKLFKSYII